MPKFEGQQFLVPSQGITRPGVETLDALEIYKRIQARNASSNSEIAILAARVESLENDLEQMKKRTSLNERLQELTRKGISVSGRYVIGLSAGLIAALSIGGPLEIITQSAIYKGADGPEIIFARSVAVAGSLTLGILVAKTSIRDIATSSRIQILRSSKR